MTNMLYDSAIKAYRDLKTLEPLPIPAHDTLLSINLQTYNRKDIMLETLEHIIGWADRRVEIILFDNGSTDGTHDAILGFMANYQTRPSGPGGKPTIRHMKSETNLLLANSDGVIAVLIPLFKGKYFFSHSDDDRVDPKALFAEIEYMERRPDVVASFPPWAVRHATTGEALQPFYQIPGDIVFTENERGVLFDFVVRHHILPEIGVFRTKAVDVKSDYAFGPFVWLDALLKAGGVRFHNTPFYTVLLGGNGAAVNSGHWGSSVTLKLLDNIRCGLELLAPDGSIETLLKIQRFMNIRSRVAANMTGSKSLAHRCNLWDNI